MSLLRLVLPLILPAAALAAGPSPVSVKVLSIEEERGRSVEPSATNPFGPKNRLSLSLVIAGEDVAKATHWGNLTVTAAKDEAGNDLRADPNESGLASLRELVPLDREQMWFFEKEKPKDRIKVELPLKAPPRGSRTLARIEGSLKLTSARTVEVVSGPLSGLAGKALNDPALKAAGLSVEVSKVRGTAGDLAQLTVVDPQKALLEMKVVDAAGNPISSGQMSMSTDSRSQVTLMGEKPLPPAGRLRLLVVTERKEVTVPILLENVQLP